LDLHFTNARPLPEERAAVDAELGTAGAAGNGRETRVISNGHARSQRHQLLPVLHAIQSRMGWISPGALNYAAMRLGVAPAEVHGVASFYGMFSLEPAPVTVAHVCDDIACRTRGSEKLCGELEYELGPEGRGCTGMNAAWRRSACLGLCERAPAALVTVAGEAPADKVIAPATVAQIQAAIEAAEHNRLPSLPDELKVEVSVPQAGSPQMRLLNRIGQSDVITLAGYRRSGGYNALQKALELGPERVLREVGISKLLGRGGAAFPTVKKWEVVRQQSLQGKTCYLVCNADESEPGTFKDRILMEGDPFAVLEGMTIAAFACGAEKGFIYLRGEYPLAAERISHAIAAARKEQLLGEKILGSGVQFDIEVRRGGGAYICGEETALFNSIEGYRGEPRNKPPFPTDSGLFRQPTAVNNVETLANVPRIILEGGAAYALTATESSTGTRLFCLSGHVRCPGLYEAPMGTTLRALIDLAGGVAGSGRLQAVLLGGAAGTFVSPEELDVPLSFEGMRAIGATLGSGVVMLFDDTVDLRRVLLRIAEFFRHETCGQCVPCRVGVVRQQEALERLTGGKPLGGVADELALLKEISQAMRDASICGLGQTASSAVDSALKRWRLFS
jgi:NADH-quinone oxidoreductase subunit F